jgi:hypothetical protein
MIIVSRSVESPSRAGCVETMMVMNDDGGSGRVGEGKRMKRRRVGSRQSASFGQSAHEASPVIFAGYKNLNN